MQWSTRGNRQSCRYLHRALVYAPSAQMQLDSRRTKAGRHHDRQVGKSAHDEGGDDDDDGRGRDHGLFEIEQAVGVALRCSISVLQEL